MLKILIWGLVIYYVYRFFQQKAQLWDGGKQQQKFKEYPPQNEKENGKDDEGEYIDYEELN